MQEMNIKPEAREWYVWENVYVCVRAWPQEIKAEQPSGRAKASNDDELDFFLMPFHQRFLNPS